MEEIFTYLIKSLKTGKYYVGISKNPRIRLKLHNQGNQKSTAKNRPFTLVCYKKHEDYPAARKHEQWLKKKNKDYKDNLVKNSSDIADMLN